MWFHKILLPLQLTALIGSLGSLAVTVPVIARDIQNGTVTGNGTDTPQKSNWTEPGLGSDPVNTGHGQRHDFKFFEATPENIKASKFGTAYVNWIRGIDKSSEAWQNRISEPDFFAKNVLEWPDDVYCGIGGNGCSARPLCNDISARIENRTRARQICYIFDSFHHASLITAQISEQSSNAQNNGLTKARNLAKTFFWQFDPAVQKKCDMVANLVKSIITAIEFAAMAGAPLAKPAQLGGLATEAERVASLKVGLGEGAALEEVEVGEGAGVAVEEIATTGSDVEEATVTEVETVETGPDGEGGAGNEGGSEGEGGSGGGVIPPTDGPGETDDPPKNEIRPKKRAPGAKMPWLTKQSYYKNGEPKKIGWHRIAEGRTGVVANALMAFPVNLGGPAITEAIYKGCPNARPEDEDRWTGMLSDSFGQAGQHYRAAIGNSSAEMIHGNGFGTDGAFVEPFQSILAETIFHGDYVRLTEYERHFFIEDVSKLEEAMTAFFMNAAISLSLKSSMCYMHCTSNHDFKRSDAALYVVPEPGVVCQPECWQNWDSHKGLKMFGIDVLMNENNSWGVDAGTFLDSSYKHWQWSRYSAEYMYPTVDQLHTGSISDSTSGASLPICFSSQPIRNYEDKSKTSESLPCICGDEWGNETISFFREANFANWVAAEGGKGVAESCHETFTGEDIRPVQAYLTFCKLGWHFPVHAAKHDPHASNRGHHNFGQGKDVMCDEVEREVKAIIDRGGDAQVVNCHLCWLSKAGQAIKDNQRSYVHHDKWALHNYHNFKNLCEWFMSKKEVCHLVT